MSALQRGECERCGRILPVAPGYLELPVAHVTVAPYTDAAWAARKVRPPAFVPCFAPSYDHTHPVFADPELEWDL